MAAVENNSYVDIHLESIQEETFTVTPPLPSRANRVVIPRVPCKRIGNYLIGKTIGSGTSSKVKIGTHVITGKKVAVKITKPKRVKERKEIEREISILKLLKHNHIIQLHEAIYEEDRGRICLVLELISGGELFDYIVARGRLSEKESRKFFRQILSGLIYCHDNMVCHRDLKLENLLVDDDGNIKISDFGYSNIIKPGHLMSTFCGSPVYAPPEILLEKKYNGNEVDIWSIGVILYAMVTGQLPWSLTDGVQVEGLDRLLKGEFKYPSNVILTNEVKELINKMIVANPSQRAKLSDIKSHSWVNKGYDMLPDEEYNAKNRKFSLGYDNCTSELDSGSGADASQRSYVKVNKSPMYSSTPNLLPNLPSPRGASISVNSAPCGSPMLSGSNSPNLTTPPLSPISSNNNYSSISSPPTPSSNSSKTSLFHGLFKKKQSQSRSSSSNNGADSDYISTPGSPTSSSTSSNSLSPIASQSSEGAVAASSSTSSSAISSPSHSPVVSSSQPQTPSHSHPHSTHRRFSLEDIFKVIKGKSKSRSDKIRSVKGPFSSGTTTSMSPSDILIKCEKVLSTLNGFKFNHNGYVFECKHEDNEVIDLEIEICRVSGMAEMFGIKFKRLSGDVWSYSTVVNLIVDSLQL